MIKGLYRVLDHAGRQGITPREAAIYIAVDTVATATMSRMGLAYGT